VEGGVIDHQHRRPGLGRNPRLFGKARFRVGAPGVKIVDVRIDGDERRALGAEPLREQAEEGRAVAACDHRRKPDKAVDRARPWGRCAICACGQTWIS
jgi:hypothetical protein